MIRHLFAACAVAALAGCATPAAPPSAAAGPPTLTAAEAKAFVDKAEADLKEISLYTSRVSWVRATYINEDTDWLSARADAQYAEMESRLAVEAARFNGVEVDPVTRRKLTVLQRGITQPAPQRPGAAKEIADLSTKLDSIYSTGKFQHGGKAITLTDAEEILAKARDPAELKAVYEGWRTVSPPMKPLYTEMTALMNEGARDLGHKDAGALWRSDYDMPPDAFAAKTDQLWSQVEPFYRNLHCYVRARLNAKYGDAVQPKTGPIRADLVGNMWSQQWGNIYDVVAPKGVKSSYDLDKLLVAKGYDAEKMMRTGEGFYSSIGFAPLPQTFWERSMITRPRDREVVCHASAWDIDDDQDIRVKMCTKVTAEDFQTIHHELGHNYYQRAYARQPYLFRGGANDGFHEAIGDVAGMNAFTPAYLKQIGLLDREPGPEEDIPYLLKMALDKIAFLPFGLMVDQWRWRVFSGEIQPERYNDAWWEMARRYQGIAPPGPRPAGSFDPGAKYHVAASVPYTRYFLAHIYEFQFYRAACRQAGWTGPLNRCSVYGNKEVGAKLNAMLAMGQSQPWPVALEAFTGEKDIDATAVADYFAPLDKWLTEQNKEQQCGW
jgi:peptidyl-dipeptidase A